VGSNSQLMEHQLQFCKHDSSSKLVYKVPNKYANDGRQIFCFSDPPHARNCWASSYRILKVKLDCVYISMYYCLCYLSSTMVNISRQHLRDLYYYKDSSKRGVQLVPKLKYEHVHLNSFPKMRVDLAAKLLLCAISLFFAISTFEGVQTVSKVLTLSGDPEVTETAKFEIKHNCETYQNNLFNGKNANENFWKCIKTLHKDSTGIPPLRLNCQ